MSVAFISGISLLRKIDNLDQIILYCLSGIRGKSHKIFTSIIDGSNFATRVKKLKIYTPGSADSDNSKDQISTSQCALSSVTFSTLSQIYSNWPCRKWWGSEPWNAMDYCYHCVAPFLVFWKQLLASKHCDWGTLNQLTIHVNTYIYWQWLYQWLPVASKQHTDWFLSYLTYPLSGLARTTFNSTSSVRSDPLGDEEITHHLSVNSNSHSLHDSSLHWWLNAPLSDHSLNQQYIIIQNCPAIWCQSLVLSY